MGHRPKEQNNQTSASRKARSCMLPTIMQSVTLCNQSSGVSREDLSSLEVKAKDNNTD